MRRSLSVSFFFADGFVFITEKHKTFLPVGYNGRSRSWTGSNNGTDEKADIFRLKYPELVFLHPPQVLPLQIVKNMSA